MAITQADFNKIWASTSPLTPYEFSESNYKEGWNFIGATPPSRQMWDSLQRANDEKFKFLRDNFGTPNMVTTAAQMTDTDKIYVYVGSEAGWNNGHWYYYDADTSTWVDGGVYNSTAFVTDTTLTEAGKAADAKAVGDALALKADLAGATFTGNVAVNADFSTTGDATVGGDLTVSGVTTLTGNVTANGNISVVGDIDADNITLNGDIDATDVTASGDVAAGTLSVSGATTLTGNVTAGANITASGDVTANDASFANATLSGTLTVSGATTLDGLTVGSVSAQSLNTTGNASVGGTLTVSGATTLADITAGDINADDVAANGNLSVVGNATLNGVSTAVTPAEDDNSTNIATTAYVQTEIKPIETDVTINDKRISNIEKLLQGNLYDYQTDTDSKYTKTVPSGALPYASLDSVGGKTLVWNQLNDNSASTATNSGVTLTNNQDGSWTVNNTATGDFAKSLGQINLVNGHKYYVGGCPSGGSDSTFYLSLQGYSKEYGDGAILSWTSTTQSRWLQFSYFTDVSFSNVTFYPIVRDLTLMFGSGNEPSTVAEYKSIFPTDTGISYNAGQLLSAGVTEVVSNGKNTWNMMNPWFYGKDFYNQSVGHQFSGNSPTARPTDNGDGTFSFTPSANWYGFIYLLDVSISNEDVRAKVTFRGTDLRSSFYRLDKNFKVLYKGNGASSSGVNSWDVLSNKDTYPNMQYIAFGVGTTTGGSTITVENPQCEVSDTATDYSPYHAPIQYPIPAEVQALEGYGWSAGTAYNYIDYERKVFVKNVERVDLGGLSWTTYATGIYRTLSALVGTVIPANVGDVPNLICPKYTTNSNTYTVEYETRKNGNITIRYSRDGARKGCIFVTDDGYADSSAFKTAMDGVYLYYELATPIEIDISAYLSDDNLISVESGGTLTFPNSNGDNYRIPVPSAETYMVDLQSAI